MKKLYAVAVNCHKGHEHIVSVAETEMDAWADAPLRYAGLDDARTVRVPRTPKYLEMVLHK
jgi:hypothetical protein